MQSGYRSVSPTAVLPPEREKEYFYYHIALPLIDGRTLLSFISNS